MPSQPRPHVVGGLRAATLPALSDLGLGLGMAVSTALGYAFSVVMSRALGPADFGALSALIGIGLLGSIPAGALQVVVARRIAVGEPHGSALRLSLLVGAVLAGLVAAVSPLLRELLHLPHVGAVLALGCLLVPMTATGVFQGTLLGRREPAKLASLYVVTAAGRLLAGVGCAVASAGVTSVLWASVAMAVLAALWGRRLSGPVQEPVGAGRHSLPAETLRASATMAALIAVTNVDLVLARHFLDRQASGDYALAALFGKVVFWLSQFIGLVLVPRASKNPGPRPVNLALLAVVALGSVATGVVALAPTWWVVTVGGGAYAGAATPALAFTVVGTLWALLQVLLFGQLGRNRPGIALVVWAATAMQVALCVLWLHGDALQVLAAVAVGAVVALAGGLVVLVRTAPRVRDPVAPR